MVQNGFRPFKNVAFAEKEERRGGVEGGPPLPLPSQKKTEACHNGLVARMFGNKFCWILGQNSAVVDRMHICIFRAVNKEICKGWSFTGLRSKDHYKTAGEQA